MTKIITFWRFVIQLGWARSLTWALTTEKEKRIYIFTLHIVKRGNDKALSFVIGPVSVLIGVVG